LDIFGRGKRISFFFRGGGGGSCVRFYDKYLLKWNLGSGPRPTSLRIDDIVLNQNTDVLVHTRVYFCVPVRACTYLYVPVYTCVYLSVQGHNGGVNCVKFSPDGVVPVCTCMYLYIPVCSRVYRVTTAVSIVSSSVLMAVG